MAKQRRIKARVEINLSEDHLGLARVFDELAKIEDGNKELTAAEVNTLKRRYMLSILYKYSAPGSAAAVIEPVQASRSFEMQSSKLDAPAFLTDPATQAISTAMTPSQPVSVNIPTKQEASLAADKAIAAGIDASFQ